MGGEQRRCVEAAAVEFNTDARKPIVVRRSEIAPKICGKIAAKLFTIQRQLIAAGNDPCPIAVIDTVIWIETSCRLIGGSADDEVSCSGQDFIMTVDADDLERHGSSWGIRTHPH
jgi:hypothetical protein